MSSMIQTSLRRAGGALAVAAAGILVAAGTAHASSAQLSVIEDEHRMLELGPQTQAGALDDAVNLGADVIRANVIWARYAPSPNSTRKPKGFDAKDPNSYPGLAIVDSLVTGAQERGLQVLLTPTGPIPAWASRCKGSVSTRHTCKPNAQLFGQFVRALGKRYPTVKMWSVWNEPNLRSWLSPQYSGTKMQSAALYRSLARSAISSLRGTGHRSDTILLGETAPIGQRPSSRANANPEPFIRNVLCLQSNGRKLTGAAAAAQQCNGFKKLAVKGYAHHPYTRGGSRAPNSRVNTGEITAGSISRLTRILDQAGRAGRVPRKLPVFYTENGWQTNPPDQTFGVLPEQQARYMNQSDYMAYGNSRIKSVAQYKLIDDADSSSFQSGVRFLDGTAKPAYAAYQLPIWVTKKGSGVRVYGQVRPAADRAALQVEIQHAESSTSGFTTVQTVPVSSLKGTFKATVSGVSGGVWRLVSGSLVSRQAGIGT
jgi:Cellulase (glycosyl hydrolase family 5)